MHVCVVCVLVLALAGVVRTQTTSGLQCAAAKSSPLKLSVNSQHNQTGHWVSKVGLEQRPDENHDKAAVDIEHFTSCTEEGTALRITFTFTASPNGVISPAPTSDGYEYFQGIGVYKYHNKTENWTRAREVCAEEGAHLAIVNSDTESVLFITLYQRRKINSPWVGIHRIEDEFFTIFGDKLSSSGFTRWSSGEPNKGTAYCVFLHGAENKLADDSCNTKRTFICEKRL